MTDILLIILIIELFLIFFWGLKNKERVYQFPFLSSIVFAGWVLPQLVGFVNSEFGVPIGGLDKALLMSILCLFMIFCGYVIKGNRIEIVNWDYNHGRLLIYAYILSFIGIFFYWKVTLIADQVTASVGGIWSGIITVYVFFSKLHVYGFAIALLLFLRKFSKLSLFIVLINLPIYFNKIFILGRRNAIVEFCLIIFLGLWFKKRYLVPRWALILAALGGILIVNSIGDYRAVRIDVDNISFRIVSEIDYVGNLNRIFSQGGEEVRNLIYNISSVDQNNNFDYGLNLWNTLVFQYVPAQFVGSSFKESLMFDLSNPAYDMFFYSPHPGTTATGMSDSFTSFWFFGIFLFFVISYIFRGLYDSSMRGNLTAQIFIIIFFSSGLHSITHGVYWFFAHLPHHVIFVIPGLLWAKKSFTYGTYINVESYHSEGNIKT